MFAKKSLGQNFLHAPNVVRNIVITGHISPKESVLEIGPGKGVLTEALLEAGATVTAVEKDDNLIPFLNEKFKEFVKTAQLKLFHADILEISPTTIGIERPYKLIANIPYYITGEIIRKFLETSTPPECMVLMVQKEVAERIVSRDGKESILSISVKAYGKPKYVETVKARCFRPIPNVDSAILLIDSISKEFFNQHKVSEEHFFNVVRAGFAHKRKFLINNLEILAPKPILISIFNEIAISPTVRAESINTETWGRIAQKISSSFPQKN